MIGLIEKGPNSISLILHVIPRAGRTCFSGTTHNAVRLRIKALPVEGAANAECVKFLAKTFRIPRGSIKLLRGHKSREKVFEIEDISQEKAATILKSLI